MEESGGIVNTNNTNPEQMQILEFKLKTRKANQPVAFTSIKTGGSSFLTMAENQLPKSETQLLSYITI